MKTIIKLFIVFLAAYSTPPFAEDTLLEILTDEDKTKNLLCELTSTLGLIAAETYESSKDGSVTKEQAIDFIGIDEMAADSLEFELYSMAYNQAFDGRPAEDIAANMMKHCMSHTFDEVNDMSVSRSELDDDAIRDKKWEEAHCDYKLDKLDMLPEDVEMGTSDSHLKRTLALIEQPVLEAKLLEALHESEDQFYEILEEFEDNCGL